MKKIRSLNSILIKFFALCTFLFLFCTPLITRAANYYWIGGSGNWSDPTHWATTSGGTILHNQIPTAVDDVFFDANSFTASGQTVTLDPLTILCRDMSWIGVTNNPTLSGISANLLKIYGSLSFAVGMNMGFLGRVNFESVTTGRTILSNGKKFNWDVIFNGVGGEWTLQDSLRVENKVVLNNGTLNTNNRAVVASGFESSTTTTRAINMGSSIFTLNGSSTVWDVTSAGMTLNCGTSVINVVSVNAYNYFEGGDKTYYDLNFTSINNEYECSIRDNNIFRDVNFASNGVINSNNTFRNVVFNKNGRITSNNVFANLTFSPSFSYILQSGTTQTINGNFNAIGNCGAFVDISSNNAGATANITKTTGVVNSSYLILKEINATGGATFNAINGINLGNSAGWNFTSPAAKNLYWIGDTGNWNDGSHWALTSGGAASGCAPSPIDNVFFDANSFSTTGQVVTINTPTAYCNNMSWVGATNTPTLGGIAANLLKIYGSLTFVPNMLLAYQGQVSFDATVVGKTITNAGLTFRNVVSFNGVAGGWVFQDAFTTLRDLSLNAGTLTTNNQNVNVIRFFTSTSSVKVLNMGSSIFNVSDPNNPWNITATAFTLNAGTSTINITGNGGYLSFDGGGKTYHNVNFSNAAIGSQGVITNNNIFNDVVFSSQGRITGINTFRNVTFFGRGEFLNNNTFNDLTFAAGQTYTLTSGRTQTLNGALTAVGNCNGLIEIVASLSGSQSTISKPNGVISVSSVILRDMVATGGATFTANNAVNLGNNTGWNFTTPVSTNLYWIGNSGNWDDGNHWSFTSGGLPANCAPSPADNVFFDLNSFSLANQIVTVNIPTAYCRNMSWIGVTNMPTIAGVNVNSLKIFGSLTFFENMNVTFLGTVSFEATTTNNTISMRGKRIENIQFNGTGSWVLQDSLKVNRAINLNSGTLTTNNNAVVAGSFRSVTTNVTRTLNMGSSIFTLSNIIFFWEVRNAGFNVNAGTSTINATGSSSVLFFNGGNKVYYDLNFVNANAGNAGTIYDDNTFHNVVFNAQGRVEGINVFNTATFRADGRLANNNTFNTLIFSAGHSYIAFSGRTQTIINRWQVQGSCVSYVLLESSTAGAVTTFTKAIGAVSGYNIHLKDIRTTGGASFFAYNSVNLGGNVGWVFAILPGLLPPNDIIGPTAVCSNAQGVVYRTTPVTGAIYYQWAVPPGATISSGQGDTIITVNFGTNVVGNVSLQSFNGCNYSSITTNLAITLLGIQLTPSVAIVANPGGAVCPNLPVTFTATAASIGTAVATYNFYVNGVSMQNGNSNTYTTAALLNADMVTCIMNITGGSTCFTAATATSNAITMVVSNTAGLTPTVQIVKTPAGNVCVGTALTFTATTTNTNGTVTYNFKVNNVNVQSTSSNIYSTNALLNNDVVTCDISIVGGTCLAATTALSNSILINLLVSVTPSVVMAPSITTTICSGTSISFTATAANVNGGSVTYNFMVNGLTVQNNSSNIYTTTTLVNSDVVRCEINITNALCLTSNTALSNSIIAAVAPFLLPTVLLSSNTNGVACSGAPIVFTATASNTSTGVVAYNFRVNGLSAQNGSSNIFTTTTLANADVVTCTIAIVGGLCLQAPTALSNNFIANISANYAPTVSLSLNTSLPICAGSNVSFSAIAANINGGSVTYIFKVNGSNVQSGAANSFTTNALAHADVVTCDISITGGTCLLNNTAASNSVNMVITPVLQPIVRIVSSVTNICVGLPVTYSATVINGGASPILQWKLNGQNVGSNSNTYTTTTLSSTDIVTCVLTSNLPCVTSAIVSSNAIQVSVDNSAQPSLTISANKVVICKDDEVIFTASPLNTSNAITYQWKLNGLNVGNNSPSYSSSNLNNNDVVHCDMTTKASCSVSPYISNSVTMIVKPKPVITFGLGNTSILFESSITLSATLSGNIASYAWSPTNSLTNYTSLTPIAKPLVTTLYNLQATTTDNCKAESSLKITVLRGIYIPNAFTPNGDGINDLFRIPATAALASIKSFTIFNRYGVPVFVTSDKSKGWDGFYKGAEAPTGSYIYIISGNDVKGEVLLKGTILLIR